MVKDQHREQQVLTSTDSIKTVLDAVDTINKGQIGELTDQPDMGDII